MLVTSLSAKGKTMTRVTIDYDRTLVLSNRDLYLYGIEEGSEISESVWNAIVEDQKKSVLAKCGRLLQSKDYTEAELLRKLSDAGYLPEVAGDALSRLKEAGYVNEEAYVRSYVSYHLQDRSITRIRADLLRRGAGKDVIENVLREIAAEEDPAEAEIRQIRELARKKHYDPGEATWEEKQKFQAFLMRRGYGEERIRRAGM